MVAKWVNHNDTTKNCVALKAQDGALIGVSSPVNLPSHENGATSASEVDIAHDVLPDASFSGPALDTGVQTGVGHQTHQIEGRKAAADSTDMAKLSPKLGAGKVHTMKVEPDGPVTDIGRKYDPDHSTTATSKQITNLLQSTPLPTSLVASAVGQDSGIVQTSQESELTVVLTTEEDGPNDATSLAQSSSAQRMPSGDSAWWRIWDKQRQAVSFISGRVKEEDGMVCDPFGTPFISIPLDDFQMSMVPFYLSGVPFFVRKSESVY
jgi:hypothetical protein